ncbi:MAG: DegT/DnrJ/EryC1/StrS family aminotransferase [Geminicoccaceae bacterium]|nr:MAG: DegT/DnrJ/EryC1/StrS family aminotransferase [Geminicoccaceae bacterium]
MDHPPLPFIDLQAQRARIAPAVEAAVLKVVREGRYILGPEVQELERELAAYCGAKHCLTCASGTDALALFLMAKGLRTGDAVICPTFTFAATAEVVAWLGASPVFADIDPDTFCLDPASVERAIATAKAEGLQPRGIIAVDLFGHPADYDRLLPIAEAHGLWLMDDAAQGFGATYRGTKLGTFGDFTATSFFPAKPLGCYGDGGAVFFEDDALVEVLTSLRVHGQGQDKYDNVRIGMNGRMDTIQCAVVLEKLKIFDDEIEARNRIAQRYTEGLAELAKVPTLAADCTSIWAQYTLVLPTGTDRPALQARLSAAGIPTAVYYGKPMHRQTAYARFPVAGNGLPVAEDYAARVISLPMHAYLADEDQDRIVSQLRAALTD